MKSFVLILALSVCLFAHDVYLKNGEVIRNAKLIDTSGNSILVEINGAQREILKSEISKLDFVEYDPDKETEIIQAAKLHTGEQQTETAANQQQIEKKGKSNPVYFAVALVALATSIDAIAESDQLADGKDKTRKQIIGASMLAVSLGCFALGFSD